MLHIRLITISKHMFMTYSRKIHKCIRMQTQFVCSLYLVVLRCRAQIWKHIFHMVARSENTSTALAVFPISKEHECQLQHLQLHEAPEELHNRQVHLADEVDPMREKIVRFNPFWDASVCASSGSTNSTRLVTRMACVWSRSYNKLYKSS